jgi:hypothetical protein
MKKADFWKSDWFFGVVVSVVMLILGNGELLQGLERKAYDMGVGSRHARPSDKVAVIAIDKPSLDNIGRWPWSREIMADMVDKLAAAKAKVIATTVFYSEPQRDQGLAYINKLIEPVRRDLPTRPLAAAPASPPASGDPAAPAPARSPMAAAVLLSPDRIDPARGRPEAEHRPPSGGCLWPRPATSRCRCCSCWASRAAGRTRICPITSRRTPSSFPGPRGAALPTLGVDAGVIEPLGQGRPPSATST